jgi:hypothetical protein
MEKTEQDVEIILKLLYDVINEETNKSLTVCGEMSDRDYACTRAAGHSGQHIAQGGDICDIWRND